MTYGFSLLTVGVLLLLSGVNNQRMSDLLRRGPRKGAPGPAERGFSETLVALSSGTGGGSGGGNSSAAAGSGPGMPANVPRNKASVLAKAIAAATKLHGRWPYSWGGGHAGCCKPGGEGENDGPGYDCSGAVSCVLCSAGLLSAPQTSGGLMSYGSPGPGKWITIYTNPEHVFMKIAGVWFGTGSAKEALRGGPAWGNHDSLSGYTVRHPTGY